MTKKIKDLLESPTFCLMPFMHLNYKVDGTTSPCFRSRRVSDYQKDQSGWNSEKWKQLRKDLSEGKRNEICKQCWQLEDSGACSYRQMSLEPESFHFKNWADSVILNEDFSVDSGPKEIEFRFSNKCNLQCRMCGPLYSSKWQQEFRERAEEYKESGMVYFRESLSETLPELGQHMLNDLKRWKGSLEYIMIAGGEPLIQDEHIELLRILKPNASKITLEYSTNLSNLEYKGISFTEEWKDFKEVILKVSVDGDPFIYPYVRKYGDIERVQKNLKAVLKNDELKNVKVIGTLTVSAYNIPRIIPSIKFLLEMGVLIHTSIVNDPDSLSPQVLPNKIKEQITLEANDFLKNLDQELELYSFPRYPKEKQRERIKKYLGSVISFMNGKDESHLFKDFLKYDQIINNGKEDIFNYYPNWKNYCP
jgi:organic radical activating enzyme